jgi:hypothetical protein
MATGPAVPWRLPAPPPGGRGRETPGPGQVVRSAGTPARPQAVARRSWKNAPVFGQVWRREGQVAVSQGRSDRRCRGRERPCPAQGPGVPPEGRGRLKGERVTGAEPMPAGRWPGAASPGPAATRKSPSPGPARPKRRQGSCGCSPGRQTASVAAPEAGPTCPVSPRAVRRVGRCARSRLAELRCARRCGGPRRARHYGLHAHFEVTGARKRRRAPPAARTSSGQSPLACRPAAGGPRPRWRRGGGALPAGERPGGGHRRTTAP